MARRKNEREPICPKCWAVLRARVPLNYDTKVHVWRCKHCPLVVIDPDDGYRSAEDIEHMLQQPTLTERRERAECLYPNGHMAPRGRWDKSGSSGGGRRKQPKRTPVPWYNTTDRTATEG